MILDSNELTKLKHLESQFFWDRLASFGLLGLIIEPHINLPISTHCRLDRLAQTIYWKSPISILGISGNVIEIFLEKNG